MQALQKATAHAGFLGPGESGGVELTSDSPSGRTNEFWIWALTDNGTTADLANVTDTAGNTYTILTAIGDPGITLYVAIALNIVHSSANTNTISFEVSATGPSCFWDVVAAQYGPSAGVRAVATNKDYGMGAQVPNVNLPGTSNNDIVTMMMSDGNGNGTSTTGSFGTNAASAIYAPDPNGDIWMIQDGLSNGSSPLVCTAGVSDDYWVCIALALKPAGSTAPNDPIFFSNNQ
jgi:hypothetical protein